MPVTIEIFKPIDGQTLKFKVSWTDDLEKAADYLDPLEPGAARHAIVFFSAGKGSGTNVQSEEFDTGVKYDSSYGKLASFTALAVLGTEVVAKERKYVRNGTGEHG